MVSVFLTWLFLCLYFYVLFCHALYCQYHCICYMFIKDQSINRDPSTISELAFSRPHYIHGYQRNRLHLLLDGYQEINNRWRKLSLTAVGWFVRRITTVITTVTVVGHCPDTQTTSVTFEQVVIVTFYTIESITSWHLIQHNVLSQLPRKLGRWSQTKSLTGDH